MHTASRISSESNDQTQRTSSKLNPEVRTRRPRKNRRLNLGISRFQPPESNDSARAQLRQPVHLQTWRNSRIYFRTIHTLHNVLWTLQCNTRSWLVNVSSVLTIRCLSLRARLVSDTPASLEICIWNIIHTFQKPKIESWNTWLSLQTNVDLAHPCITFQPWSTNRTLLTFSSLVSTQSSRGSYGQIMGINTYSKQAMAGLHLKSSNCWRSQAELSLLLLRD